MTATSLDGLPLFTAAQARREALEAIAEHAPRLCSAVLAALRRRPEGLTPDEIADAIGESVLAVRPRITELKEAKLVRCNGRRRTNRSGRYAAVVEIVP